MTEWKPNEVVIDEVTDEHANEVALIVDCAILLMMNQ